MRMVHGGCAPWGIALMCMVTLVSTAHAAPAGTPPPPIDGDADGPVVVVQQQPAWTPPPPTRRRRTFSPAATGGLSIFGASYGITFLTGLFALMINDELGCDNCTEVGASFLLPAIGPFIAMKYEVHHEWRVVSGVLGGFQILGLTVWAFSSLAGRSRANASTTANVQYMVGPSSVGLSVAF
jgi:hypothetical protein